MKTSTGYVMRPLGKEFILTAENVQQVNFNRMISLNSSAAYLWESVEGKDFSIQDLADLLVERYGIEMDTAMADSEALVAKWKEAGLLEE